MTIEIEIDFPSYEEASEVLDVDLIRFMVPNSNYPIILVDCIQGCLKPIILSLAVLGEDVFMEVTLLVWRIFTFPILT